MSKFVVKRDGSREELNIEKIHKVVNWAIDGIAGVSLSDVEMGVKMSLFDGITTSQIHDLLIESASNLISEESPNYSKVASRLLNFSLRKEAWGGKNPPKLLDLIQKNIKAGRYHNQLLGKYTEKEIHKIDELLDHNRDYDFEFGGLLQMKEKYLCQDRDSGQIYETPQFSFILIGMVGFQNEKNGDKIKWIKKFYDSISRGKLNIPTPILAGARSPLTSYASCCLIDIDDTKDSLFAANTTAGLTTCDRYGIGLNLSRIRPINSPIRQGETLHSGVIAWLKMYQSTIHACQQGGARRGAGTVTFPIFHPEIMTILELKNNQGTHENRVPHLDYSISISNLFYDRLKKGENITLIGSDVAPDLYSAFGMPEFDELYKQYEKKDIKKKVIPAKELFAKFFKERLETGRIYCVNIDQANSNSPWINNVKFSNLCQEVLTDCNAENYTGDPNAEVGVCTLSAINMLKMKSEPEHRNTCELLVRFLDNILDIQDYAVPACKKFATEKRSLGIGVTNLAAWLASQGLNHDSPEAPKVVSEYMEKQQYYLMQASIDLAKERGPAPAIKHSKYYQGKNIPIDLYNKNVDKVLRKHKMDWEKIRDGLKEHGIRNMTLSCIMPCQSSSVTFGTTNGVEPITSLVSRQTSKGKTTIQVAPSIFKWKNFYKKKSEFKDNVGIIKVNAAITKWLDMAISFNLYYDSQNYDGGNIPLSVLIKDHLYATHLGLKTFYYCNSRKKDDPLAEEESGCESGACVL